MRSEIGRPRVPRSANRSYRIDDDVDAALQELAFRERVSVNTVTNRALRHYVEWESRANKFGFVSIPRSLQTKLFAHLTEKEATELGEWAGQNLMINLAMFFFKKMDYDVVLAVLRLLALRAGMFSFEHATDVGNDILILKHDSGRMVSIYIEAFLKALLQRCIRGKVETQITEDQVIARVNRPTQTSNLQSPSVVEIGF